MNQAERIIARFGGIRPMASKLGIAVTTVQGWKERGTIPKARHAEILAAAQTEGIAIGEDDLAGSTSAGGHIHSEPAPAGGSAASRAAQGRSGGRPKSDISGEGGVNEDTSSDIPVLDAETIEAGAAVAAKELEAEDAQIEDVEAEEVDIAAAAEETPTVTVQTTNKSGRSRPALAGGLSGLAAAALVVGLYHYFAPASGPVDTSAFANRLAAAEQAAKAASRAAQAAVTRAEAAERRAALAEKRVAAFSRPAAARAARLAAVETRAAAAAKAAAELQTALQALETRLKTAASVSTGGSEALAEAVARLRTQVDALEKRASTLAVGGVPNATSKLAEENKKAIIAATSKTAENATGIGTLNERTAAQEKTLKAEIARLDTAAQALTGRLAALERLGATRAAGRGREAALVAAIGQLREAVKSGRPFSDELEAVKALAPTPPEGAITALSGTARTGVPLERALRARFPGTAVAIMRASRVPKKGNWVDRAVARARSVVVVRRTGPNVKGSSPEALVAQAEAQLKAGDLAGAIEALEGLKGSAAAAAKPWLDDARAHQAAVSAVATLHRAAMARIGAAKAPVPKSAPPKPAQPKAGSTGSGSSSAGAGGAGGSTGAAGGATAK